MIIGESTGKTLSTRIDYVVDYLGSVTARTNSSGDVVSTNRYKPYGSVLSGDTPTQGQYAWTGNTGSRYSGIAYAEQYNRARHYSSTTKQWTTRDPLWPEEAAYGYVNGNPVGSIDPSGKKMQIVNCPKEVSDKLQDVCNRLRKLSASPETLKQINTCIKETSNVAGTTCPSINENRLTCMQNFCYSGSVTCVEFGSLNHLGYPDYPPIGFCHGMNEQGHNETGYQGTISIVPGYKSDDFSVVGDIPVMIKQGA